MDYKQRIDDELGKLKSRSLCVMLRDPCEDESGHAVAAALVVDWEEDNECDVRVVVEHVISYKIRPEEVDGIGVAVDSVARE